ncbi:LptA/OstA family protein [Aurantiacibacter sediminis]|uniref:OstA family protein n=1 Tax=Aurantiacibacter sediminis TaxID=2793064 RepID=A0ABS0MZU4_9SPHN|nr:LptA/OstA family protein [Aurantiacibacter sediminis]MBH5321233.1 OstA family protein [Aurantiacibacter sediminis]
MTDTTASRLSLRKLALRGLAAGLLAGGASALGFGALAGAQDLGGIVSNEPVSWAADNGQLQDRQNRVVLSGNVVIQQGNLRMTADRTTISYTDAGTLRIQRINATGGVVVTRGDERARGDAAVYDFNRRVIILSGGVAINRGTDRLDGGRLVLDLNSGVTSVDGEGSRASDGRVSGTFAVPESN